MKINEIQRLNEYGHVAWTWFTTDHEIFITDWVNDIGPEGREMAVEHIEALTYNEMWDGYWHLLNERPAAYPEQKSPDTAGAGSELSPHQRSKPTVRRFTKGLVPNSPGKDSIVVGSMDPDDWNTGPTLEGAIIFDDNVAVWYGDNSTWL